MANMIGTVVMLVTQVSRASVRESSITDRGLKYLLRHKVIIIIIIIIVTCNMF